MDHNGASLMVVFDKGGRFMFNTGEGLQRMMRESRVKMNKVGGKVPHMCILLYGIKQLCLNFPDGALLLHTCINRNPFRSPRSV